jgi:hypothetical protein
MRLKPKNKINKNLKLKKRKRNKKNLRDYKRKRKSSRRLKKLKGTELKENKSFIWLN